ncbi:MAG: hypothetical protein AAF916_08180 [Planctomycetota bacterium]
MDEAPPRDPNLAAARAVAHATEGQADQLSPELEAAWERWASSIQNMDERTMALCRAAFEVGAEATSQQ